MGGVQARLMERVWRSTQAYNAAGAQFITTELDLALIFCKIGMSTHSAAHAKRNAENAERALHAALRVKDRIRLSEEKEQETARKIGELELLLKRLNDRVTTLT